VEVAGRKITKYGIALLGIVLIGLLFRIYHLGTQSIWLDEAFSVALAKMTLPQMVQAAAPDVHPPLYYFLLHYWIIVFGTSESAVRLLSVLFGVLAIPMIYVVGRQLFNKQVGLVAALILALSSFNIYYSQETRMYSLMVLLALLSMYFFWRFLQQSNLVSSVGYVLSTGLLVYTHYYGWFVVIAQNIYVVTLLLLSKHRAYRLRDWAVLQAIVVALFVPWMVVLVNQILRREAAAALLAPPTTTILIYTFSSYSGAFASYYGKAVLLALFLLLSVLSLFAYQKVRGAMDWKAPLKALESYSWEVRFQDPTTVYFLVVWLLAIILIPFVLSHFVSNPIYQAMYTIAASVAFYLLVARGILNINGRYTKLAVVGIIVVLSVANLQAYYSSITRPQAREAIGLIDANANSGDVVLVSPSYQSWVWNYYNNRTDVAVKLLDSLGATPSNNSREIQTKEIQSDVLGNDRVWFLSTSGANFTLSVLNQSYANVYFKSYYGYDVYLFEKRA
jgi:mannosyltransferase